MINLGLSSETVSGLSEEHHPFPRPCLEQRLEKSLEWVKPDLVIACYGMNDGIYHPFGEERFAAYQEGIRRLVKVVKDYHSDIILMTPPIFDPVMVDESCLQEENEEEYGYLKPYRDYNQVLKKYGEWIQSEESKIYSLIEQKNQMISHTLLHHIGHGNAWLELNPVAIEDLEEKVKEIEQEIKHQLLIEQLDQEIKETQFREYKCYQFYVQGRECRLIEPRIKSREKNWVWRTEFFYAFNYADMALLEEGWYLAYCNVICMVAKKLLRYYINFTNV